MDMEEGVLLEASRIFDYNGIDVICKVDSSTNLPNGGYRIDRKIGDIATANGAHRYKYISMIYNNKQVNIPAHRFIWWLTHREIPESIDHIDCNKHNNRLSNLRSCSIYQNSLNRGPSISAKIQYKGVFKNKYSYRAMVQLCGSLISIGSYKTEQEAADAYDDYVLNTAPDDIVTFMWLNRYKGCVPSLDLVNKLRSN